MSRRNLAVVVNTGNPIADRKIQTAIEGMKPNTQRQLVNEFCRKQAFGV